MADVVLIKPSENESKVQYSNNRTVITQEILLSGHLFDGKR